MFTHGLTGKALRRISGLAAGGYTLTITDVNNCQDTLSVTITQPATGVIAAINASGPLSFCQGDSVVLTASAGEPFIPGPAAILRWL